MAFTCFNQHQSTLSFFIFIEIGSAAAGGRPFTRQRALTGAQAPHKAPPPRQIPRTPSSCEPKLGATLSGAELRAGIYRRIMAFSFPFSLIAGFCGERDHISEASLGLIGSRIRLSASACTRSRAHLSHSSVMCFFFFFLPHSELQRPSFNGTQMTPDASLLV